MRVSSVLLVGLLFSSASAMADDSPTNDEQIVVNGVVGKLDLQITDTTMKAVMAGVRSVNAKLRLIVTDATGKEADGGLPPALANLRADLDNTDLRGELQHAGIALTDDETRAPGFNVVVASVPSTKSSRKLYIVLGLATRIGTFGGTTDLFGTHGANVVRIPCGFVRGQTIVSSGDDMKDAQLVRVEVRGVVDKFIEATGVKK
jgi:hypothetical protein